jgi:enamine deaminase RidA (YjgF/YER057c/UK114 family)
VTELRRIIAEGVAPPTGLYSHAVRVAGADLLFVSGQTAGDQDGNFVGEGDAAAQTRQVFHNLGRVLEGSGAGFEDVVELTIYLVGVDSVAPFLETRAEVFRELYPDGGYPCSTLVNVASLGGSRALVEISATAAVRPGGRG